MLPQNWQLQQPTGIQSNQNLQACQKQKIRLQSLQLERERLKQRQQEIMRQVGIVSRPLIWRLDRVIFVITIFDIHASFLVAAARNDAATEHHGRRHGSIFVRH